MLDFILKQKITIFQITNYANAYLELAKVDPKNPLIEDKSVKYFERLLSEIPK